MLSGLWHSFLPDLSASAQTFIRTAYGLLLLGTLLIALPHGRRFFGTERWGGYAVSTPQTDCVQNPIVYPILIVAWLTFGILLSVGVWTVGVAFGNLLLCRYFFIHMRWKGVLRGMGAPGFLTYWLGAAVFLLELTTHYAPDARPLAVLVLQVDFALIILSAGIYKLTAGYARNEGMEFGLVNPAWGYWWRRWMRLPPGHWLFQALNHLAWATEIAAALCMLLVPIRLLGGLLLIVSFLFIATQIRLGFLCEMVVVCGVLYFPAGSIPDAWIRLVIPHAGDAVLPGSMNLPVATQLLTVALWAYMLLLPFAHGGLYYNFYARRRLPGLWQRALEPYTNFFGIILWRVFSVDLINFFVRIWLEGREGAGRTPVSNYDGRHGLRYCHVGESITVTSLFTTLKYYPSNSPLFVERLVRYARTVACPVENVLVFEYVSIRKMQGQFAFVPVAEYRVAPTPGLMTERILEPEISVHAADPVSPLHEGARPGSYAPLPG
ncbi:MAG TPA: hypothetical protein VN203_02450 [Candidatus Acidoferrum sp.]|nr:hypothetical protein [Candidatus Acidoferrum sp.]